MGRVLDTELWSDIKIFVTIERTTLRLLPLLGSYKWSNGPLQYFVIGSEKWPNGPLQYCVIAGMPQRIKCVFLYCTVYFAQDVSFSGIRRSFV